MSSFRKKMINPKTGEEELGFLIDDLFGSHRYGVVFPSDVGADDWTGLSFRKLRDGSIKVWRTEEL
jgi:hypothetical protein